MWETTNVSTVSRWYLQRPRRPEGKDLSGGAEVCGLNPGTFQYLGQVRRARGTKKRSEREQGGLGTQKEVINCVKWSNVLRKMKAETGPLDWQTRSSVAVAWKNLTGVGSKVPLKICTTYAYIFKCYQSSKLLRKI